MKKIIALVCVLGIFWSAVAGLAGSAASNAAHAAEQHNKQLEELTK